MEIDDFEIRKEGKLVAGIASMYISRTMEKLLLISCVFVLGNAVKKKWKNLRDTFAKELKKITKPCSGADPEYIGTWAFYESMLFLKVVLNPRKSDKSINETEVFTNPESDMTDLSESMTSTTSAPEDKRDVTMAVPHGAFLEDEDAEDNDSETPSMSRPTAAAVGPQLQTSPQTLKRQGDPLEAFQQKIKLIKKEQIDDDDDEDFHWFKSILPYMKQLPPLNKLRFRIQIQELLLKEISKINTYISFPK